MLGAIIGDVLGSGYEKHNLKTKEFKIIRDNLKFTDDSVMTCAIAQALMNSDINDEKDVMESSLDAIREIGKMYPYCGYNGLFLYWLQNDLFQPYYGNGNGSAMRVSPVAWMSDDMDTVLRLAKNTAAVTHNHPEAIKGAQATASAILLARLGKSIDEIRNHIENKYYKLDFTLDEIRHTYSFDPTCQGSIPQAIEAFLESTSFEDAIRNAISIGGDSDTIAAVAGSIAEAYYGVPEDLKEFALSKLDHRLRNIVKRFNKEVNNKLK